MYGNDIENVSFSLDKADSNFRIKNVDHCINKNDYN